MTRSRTDRRFDELVGKRIQAVRRVRGMKAIELAEKVGISPARLCYYESGDRSCSLSMLTDIADILKVPVGALLGKFTKC